MTNFPRGLVVPSFNNSQPVGPKGAIGVSGSVLLFSDGSKWIESGDAT